jgi:hypothetical protein
LNRVGLLSRLASKAGCQSFVCKYTFFGSESFGQKTFVQLTFDRRCLKRDLSTGDWCNSWPVDKSLFKHCRPNVSWQNGFWLKTFGTKNVYQQTNSADQRTGLWFCQPNILLDKCLSVNCFLGKRHGAVFKMKCIAMFLNLSHFYWQKTDLWPALMQNLRPIHSPNINVQICCYFKLEFWQKVNLRLIMVKICNKNQKTCTSNRLCLYWLV